MAGHRSPRGARLRSERPLFALKLAGESAILRKVKVLAGVVVAVTLALAATADVSAAMYPVYFPRVTEIASEVAGRPVDVFCEVHEDWVADPVQEIAPDAWGYTRFDPSTGQPLYAALEPRTCGYLLLLIQDPNERSGIHGREGYYGEARALLSLLHEANHLRGLRSESAAECRALGLVPGYARALGADRAHVTKLVTLARRVHGNLSPEYQIGC